jgi:hypothetical protein
MKTLFTIVLCFTFYIGFSQQRAEDFRVVGRKLNLYNEGGASIIHLDEVAGDGKAWISGGKFTNGNIEFDLKGKDVLQGSFVGMAFHGLNDSTYDAIYFRPFNFRAGDPVRRAHAVQYVSAPKYEWERLRTEFPGKYEKPLRTPPDPNDWFHVRIAVAGKKISVFVNNEKIPSLEVEQLVPINGKQIGYWVGNGSGGDWKNLKISPR